MDDEQTQVPGEGQPEPTPETETPPVETTPGGDPGSPAPDADPPAEGEQENGGDESGQAGQPE